MTYFYLPASGQVLAASQLYQNTGFSPYTDPGALAANGIYTVVPTTNPYDPYLYTPTATYIIAGNYANQSWVATPLPLTTAKETGSYEAKTTANAATDRSVCDCGYSVDLLTAVSSQDPLDRPARFQDELDEMTAISNQLDADLLAIDTATTVDEINNIVNPPSGVIHIGRTGNDFDPSYYVSFNSVTLTEADTELFILSSSTVVVYGFYVPGEFDTPPGVFTGGNYLIQIREVSTSKVIAEFECPAGYQDISF
jgi:hypothetical protein